MSTTEYGFSISAVERWTGLGADTIRAWERRHGAVRPARIRGNVRRYGPDQVRRLLLLQEATRRGHSIGQIAEMSSEDLSRLVRGDHDALEVLASWHDQRQSTALADAYLCSLARLDVDEGRRLLLLAKQLFRPLCSTFLGPLLEEIESRWSDEDDGPAPFVRATFLQQLRGLLFSPTPSGTSKVLVAGPPAMRAWTLLAALAMAAEGLQILVLEEVHPDGLSWPVGLSGAEHQLWVGPGGYAEGRHLFEPDGDRAPPRAGRSTSLPQLEAVAREWRLSGERVAQR
ncbi:MAG: MerR family transcriptional regulator [Myxococcota bacterium]